ncbi:MAG: hypothetical protein H6838_13075 [Planctomycetes bacterium]|nr:hypothetical protein [Planctomycetota bacterium]
MPTVRAAAFLFPCLLVACNSIGPSTISRDRFDYSAAMSDSWKRQALLNVVKLRYMDPPVFVEVGQIVAGYTLESGLNAGADISGGGSSGQVTGGSLGGSVKFTDRPTITYTPMTGNKFVRALMTPLPPAAVFSTIAAGWPAERVLGAALTSINGLQNLHIGVDNYSAADPDFQRALRLLRDIQRSGEISMRVLKKDEAQSNVVVIRHRTTPEIAAEGAELRRLLKLDPDVSELQLSFASAAQSPTELAVTTRSVLHIMQVMAAGVDVPEQEVAEGRATPGLPVGEESGRLVRIRCGDEAPADAFVAVRYRGRDYWVDDRDLDSKRAFAFMMMLFTLSDPGGEENGPSLTIPI